SILRVDRTVRLTADFRHCPCCPEPGGRGSPVRIRPSRPVFSETLLLDRRYSCDAARGGSIPVRAECAYTATILTAAQPRVRGRSDVGLIHRSEYGARFARAVVDGASRPPPTNAGVTEWTTATACRSC